MNRIIKDPVTNQTVLLIGFSIKSGRIFLRLYDGLGIYKREVFFNK